MVTENGANLVQLKQLLNLTIASNQIRHLPTEIGQLTELTRPRFVCLTIVTEYDYCIIPEISLY